MLQHWTYFRNVKKKEKKIPLVARSCKEDSRINRSKGWRYQYTYAGNHILNIVMYEYIIYDSQYFQSDNEYCAHVAPGGR